MAINKALIRKVYDVGNLLDGVRNLYIEAKGIQAKVALYQAGTDSQFNAAVNAIIPLADRQRLATLSTSLGSIITDLETNYSDLINPPES